jgi:flagellar assembly factor FliW
VTAATAIRQDGPVTGTVDDSAPTLEFVGPIAGFPEHRTFALAELDPAGWLCALRSLDDPGLRFLVVPPGPFFPDYDPELGDDWAEQLQLTSADDALVLLIVTPAESAGDSTVNLLAPVVVNVRTRRAAQVVLEDQAWPLRAPLRNAAG